MERFIFFFILMLVVSGCQIKSTTTIQENKSGSVKEMNGTDWTLSSTFKSNQTTMIGIPQKLAVYCGGQEFVEGESPKCMWFFWGNRSMLENASLVIKGFHKETGKTERLYVSTIGYSPAPFHGANFFTPSNMTFSKPGLWRMDVYVADKLFGSIVVNVKKKTSS